jgi:hypothetical protein
MVLRYWGQEQVYAEDFQSLVDEEEDGIRTQVLEQAVRDRGWRAIPFRAEKKDVHRHLAKGRPVIALIEVRPDRYHYVVLLSWGNGSVLLHDPAVAPFQVMHETELARAWGATDEWALVILPPTDELAQHSSPAISSSPKSASEPIGGPCSRLVQQGVSIALEGDLADAESRLTAASRLCPGSAAPFRELAGIRFKQESWSEAVSLAETAVDLDPEDELGWRLLGTSRFLEGDPLGALQAWNRLSEPEVDLIRIDGLRRTRYDVVSDRMGLAPATLLSPETLGRAQHRLAEVPSVSGSRLAYRPLRQGRADVEASVVEYPVVQKGVALLVEAGVNALTERTVAFRVASPTGGGELLRAGWRWWENRPSVWVSLATPGGLGLPGTTELEGLWDVQSYLTNSGEGGEGLVRETRRRAAMTVGDWLTRALRAQVGVAIDGWEDRGTYFSFSTAVDRRFAGDRVSVRGEGAAWTGLGLDDSFASWGLGGAWRSTAKPGKRVVTARAEARGASNGAPLALWPGAGTGKARPLLLRAHPLLDGGIVVGESFGRILLHAGVEVEALQGAVGPTRITLAGFADWAKGWDGLLDKPDVPWELDLGAGLRLKLPGQSGSVRVDVAAGVNGGFAVSAAWQMRWPN